LNGVYLVAGSFTQGWRNRFFGAIGLNEDTVARKAIMFSTTFIITCVAWIVFRARNISDAAYVFFHLTSNWNIHQLGTEQFLPRQFPVAIAAIAVLEVSQLVSRKVSIPSLVIRMPIPARWALYASFVMAVLMLGVYKQMRFIYFQF